MMERRSFLAILAVALGLPKALWQRHSRVHTLTDVTITWDKEEADPIADIERAARDFRAWQREVGITKP